MVTWCPSANTGASVHAAATRAVPVVSVTAPGATHPAARAAAVWSMAPVATGMPGGRPRASAGPGSRGPTGSPQSSSSGSIPTGMPAAARASSHRSSRPRWNQPVEVCRDFSPASRPVSQCRR